MPDVKVIQQTVKADGSADPVSTQTVPADELWYLDEISAQVQEDPNFNSLKVRLEVIRTDGRTVQSITANAENGASSSKSVVVGTYLYPGASVVIEETSDLVDGRNEVKATALVRRVLP